MEQWRAVVGYEGFYEVSDHGRVRRLGGTPRCKATRILAPRLAGAGYQSVGLYLPGKNADHYIHRLVMAAFVGPCPDGCNVNHKDADKKHNCLANLEYVTFSQNSKHGYEIGSHANHRFLKGVEHGSVTISECMACDVWDALANGERPMDIHRRLRVSSNIVYGIRRGTIWRGLADPSARLVARALAAWAGQLPGTPAG